MYIEVSLSQWIPRLEQELLIHTGPDMSKCKEFQSRVLFSFSKFGFRGIGRTRKYTGIDADSIINVQSADIFCFINVGFIIHAIDNIDTSKVEKSHLYFRLERIFPEYGDIITSASEYSEVDFDNKIISFINLIESVLARKLCDLTEFGTLKQAYSSGLFINGVVTPAARKYLTMK